MKFLTILFVFAYLASLLVAKRRRHTRRSRICDKGEKKLFESCNKKLCGSECGAGLSCQKNNQEKLVCLKEYLTSKCESHNECANDMVCENDYCHALPWGMTQKDVIKPKPKRY